MSFRYERRLPGIGSVRKATGLTDAAEFREFCGVMETAAKYHPELVRLFVDGELAAQTILFANRKEMLSGLVPDARLLLPLWGEDGAFARTFAKHRKADGTTVQRYLVSVKKFERLTSGLNVVRDLERVDYEELARSWPGSPSDYMAFYRMLSTFLTLYFGGKRIGRHHAFRFKVMDLLPRKKERARVPLITPVVFSRLVSLTPDYAQPVYHTLLVTGMRMGEFMQCGKQHLRPNVFEIDVPGTKTPESAAVIPVDPAFWYYVERAIPSPIAYGQIRKHWMRACLKEGLASKKPDPAHPGRLRYVGPTLHDIRHLTAQYMTNEGVPESTISAFLRHTTVGATRRYTTQQIRVEASAALARVVSL